MLVISFDLGGPTFMAFNHDSASVTIECASSCEIKRLARNQLFGLANVGDDLLGGRLDAPAHADARKRHRRAHDLEEGAPAGRIIPLTGRVGEFALQHFAELIRLRHFVQRTPHRLFAQFEIFSRRN
jgi:hypothetical protein